MEQAKGALFLDALRRQLGDDAFFKLMSDYFTANTTKTVTAQSFLDRAGVPFNFDGARRRPGLSRLRHSAPPLPPPCWSTAPIAKPAPTASPPSRCRRASSNNTRAACPSTRISRFQTTCCAIATSFSSAAPRPIRRSRQWAGKIGLDYRGAAFRIEDKPHASEREALLLAAKNPLDAAHMVLVVAGNDALRTVKASRDLAQADHVIYEEGAPAPTPIRRRP